MSIRQGIQGCRAQGGSVLSVVNGDDIDTLSLIGEFVAGCAIGRTKRGILDASDVGVVLQVSDGMNPLTDEGIGACEAIDGECRIVVGSGPGGCDSNGVTRGLRDSEDGEDKGCKCSDDCGVEHR